MSKHSVPSKAFALLGMTLLFGCGPEHIPPPALSAPLVQSPAEAIPSDLDVVVRVDVARVRQALGPSFFENLKSRASSDAASGDAEAERLLSDAIERADVVLVGLRPGPSAASTDNVVAMSGRFSGLLPRRYATNPKFDGAVDLGGAWRLYTRPKTLDRAAPARLYVRANELVVFVSRAEIDSVERRIERGLLDTALEPPAKGVISVAARLMPIASSIAERSPAAARLLARGKTLKGSADLSASGFEAEVELEFELDEQARRAAIAARLLSRGVGSDQGLSGQIARALEVEALGRMLVARLRLSMEQLGRLTACAQSAAACS